MVEGAVPSGHLQGPCLHRSCSDYRPVPVLFRIPRGVWFTLLSSASCFQQAENKPYFQVEDYIPPTLIERMTALRAQVEVSEMHQLSSALWGADAELEFLRVRPGAQGMHPVIPRWDGALRAGGRMLPLSQWAGRKWKKMALEMTLYQSALPWLEQNTRETQFRGGNGVFG